MSKIELKLEEIPQVYERLGKTTLIPKTIDGNKGQVPLILVMQKKFRDFGLTPNESKIYIFLSKNGAKKAKDISRKGNIPRTETYHLLANLKKKRIITPSIQRPKRFSAVTIDAAIATLIENQHKKIEELRLLKEDMVYIWNSFQKIRPKEKKKFMKFNSTNLRG